MDPETKTPASESMQHHTLRFTSMYHSIYNAKLAAAKQAQADQPTVEFKTPVVTAAPAEIEPEVRRPDFKMSGRAMSGTMEWFPNEYERLLRELRCMQTAGFPIGELEAMRKKVEEARKLVYTDKEWDYRGRLTILAVTGVWFPGDDGDEDPRLAEEEEDERSVDEEEDECVDLPELLADLRTREEPPAKEKRPEETQSVRDWLWKRPDIAKPIPVKKKTRPDFGTLEEFLAVPKPIRWKKNEELAQAAAEERLFTPPERWPGPAPQ